MTSRSYCTQKKISRSHNG